MTSYLSKEVITVDIPDPQDVRVKFFYNYYTRDETVADSSRLSPAARFVSISFKEATAAESEDKSWAFEELKNILKTWSVEDLVRQELIQPEYEISTPGMTYINIEDIDIGRRLQDLTMKELSKLFPGVDINTANLSQTDLATSLNNATSNKIRRDVILDLVTDFSSDGFTFYDRDDNEIQDNTFINASAVKFDMQINDKLVGDFYKTISYDPLTFNRRAALLNSDRAVDKQSRFRKTTSAALQDSDYVPDITFIRSERVTKHDPSPRSATCGYIIERHRIDEFGDRIPGQSKSFFLTGVKNTHFEDKSVFYGSTYVYEVRTVSLVQMTIDGSLLQNAAGNKSASDILRIKFLVKSRASKQAKVKCEENIPPPPPDLITFRYDYDADCLAVKWKFPHSKQRDIKKFQIFKRQTIFEPFVLLAQYDFSDAIAPVPNIERVEPRLNIRMPQGRTIFLDENFKKNSQAIYSIVTVDAHNLTSNYSDQIMVKFNTTKNEIETSLVSPLGAPKQYPNFFVSSTNAQNLETVRYTEDVIKDSGHLKMRIYFDPEAIQIPGFHLLSREDTKSKNRSIPNIGSYKFQVINIDRQKSEIINIDLSDFRSNNLDKSAFKKENFSRLKIKKK